MAGFKTFVPIRGRRTGVTLSATALYLGAEVAAKLPKAESYNLGHDGYRRFILEPAPGQSGAVKLISCGTSSSLRCTSKQIVRFLREKLKAPQQGSIALSHKMVDGVLMFGILDSEVRT